MSEKVSIKDLKSPKSANFVVEVIQPDGDDSSVRQFVVRDARNGVPVLCTHRPDDVSTFLSQCSL